MPKILNAAKLMLVGLLAPLPAASQDSLLRLSCKGTQNIDYVLTKPAKSTREEKIATVTIDPATGLAQFQNLGHMAFNLAGLQVQCDVRRDEIRCDKDTRAEAGTAASSIVINRYSGLMVESQTFTSPSSLIMIKGQYQCQVLEKPLF